MEFLSSSQIKYEEKINKVREYFVGKDIVSRQDIVDFESKTGIQVPSKFFTVSRVSRGMFSLSKTHSTQTVKPAEHTVPVQQSSAKFNLDSMIPQQKETFVEWGNFKTVETLMSTNQFFTLYITGDSGSGKNEMVAQVCAKLKRPMVRVVITRETKEEHLIGSKTLVDGNIVYEEGPVKWAAENGAVLILDEISLGESSELMCLQEILEGQSFFVKSANQLVTPKPGFCVIATDNTKGRGSDSGRYIGTNILNDAFLERFEMTMEQGYPSEKIERKIIEKLMSSIGLVDDTFCNKLIQWVHSIRKVYIDEGLEEQITTRRACHIVKTYSKLRDEERAIELCVNRFDETTKLAMLSLWEKIGSNLDATKTVE